MAVNYLLAFSLPAVLGLLWRLGGASGYSKNYRRIGAPVTLLIWGLLSGVAWWAALISAGLLYVITTLPITLIGSRLDKGQLWWWIPLLGVFYMLSLFPIALVTSIVVWSIFGSLMAVYYWAMVVLSNKADHPKWHWMETGFGVILGLTLVLMVWGGR